MNERAEERTNGRTRSSIRPLLHSSVLGTIGQTPLVALDRLTDGLPGRLLAKLEFFSPGHSVKDRIARRIIEDAEADGRLQPGGAVVELTSGNTGIGLAIVCAVRGYRFIAVMSAGNSVERRRMLHALGARVELVPQVTGIPGMVTAEDLQAVEARTVELAHRLKAFRPDQFHNDSNVRAHEHGTGAELWQQAGGRVDVWVASPGTGGTLLGVARALKRHNPRVRVVCVEPATVPFLAGKRIKSTRHKLEGTGYARTPAWWEAALVDDFIAITDAEARRTARTLARLEGIFAGPSSGANVAAAMKLAREAKRGAVIATVINDTGLKYLSTDLFP